MTSRRKTKNESVTWPSRDQRRRALWCVSTSNANRPPDQLLPVQRLPRRRRKNVRWMLVWCRWWTRSRVDVPRRAGAARRRLIKATASRAPSSDKLLISCALQTNPAGTTEPVSMRADWFPVCWSEEQSGRRVYGSDENKTERNSIYYVNNDATISCWLVVLDFINVSFQQQDVQRTSKRCH